jgi:hypothetical protein
MPRRSSFSGADAAIEVSFTQEAERPQEAGPANGWDSAPSSGVARVQTGEAEYQLSKSYPNGRAPGHSESEFRCRRDSCRSFQVVHEMTTRFGRSAFGREQRSKLEELFSYSTSRNVASARPMYPPSFRTEGPEYTKTHLRFVNFWCHFLETNSPFPAQSRRDGELDPGPSGTSGCDHGATSGGAGIIWTSTNPALPRSFNLSRSQRRRPQGRAPEGKRTSQGFPRD